MTDADFRRRPQQARSRTRVEAILDVALALIAEHGAQALAMREVARRSDAQMGSIYQYFPSKAAVLRELAVRDLERLRVLLHHEADQMLARHDGKPSVARAANRIVDVYFSHYRDQPQAIAVWSGAQSDHGLRRLDAEDNRQTAEILVPALMQVLSLRSSKGVFALALLLTEVTGAAVRLAMSVESPLREHIIDHHKVMLMSTLKAHRQAGAVL